MSLTEILPNVRELSPADKLQLIRILAEEVEADIVPLEPDRPYVIATPQFAPGAAEALMNELKL
jgi:hypothetical protein